MPKFDTQTPQRVIATDYNFIRDKVVSVLSTGSGQRGYGQPLQSSSVLTGNNITKAQWDKLKDDLISIKQHQDGELPLIVELGTGQVIRYGAGHPNTNYDTLADQCILEKFNIGPGQFVLANKASDTHTTAWTTQAQATLTVTFAGGYTVTNADSSSWVASSSDNARHFFNSGGKIRFSSARTGGANTPQNNAWTNLLTTVGPIDFGAIDPVITNFYSLTNSYTTFYQRSLTTPYSANYYRLEALCNCTDPTNVNGTADTITFRITWQDTYVSGPSASPADGVDGTLSITVDELKAAGTLSPTGSFSILSPSYSAINISAT